MCEEWLLSCLKNVHFSIRKLSSHLQRNPKGGRVAIASNLHSRPLKSSLKDLLWSHLHLASIFILAQQQKDGV